jgi:alkylation response protein AidB-like acyl-CoA dehydrogenase
VARTTLLNERVAIAGAGGGFRERLAGRSVERLIEMARDAPLGGAIPAHDPVVRQRLAQLWIESRVVLWTNRRAAAARAAGRKAGAEGSIGKLFQSGHNQRLQAMAVDLLGHRGAACTEEDRDAMAVWYGFLRAQADSIAGGTSDIQRNILGERVLGLPRDNEGDRDLPWSQVLRNA